MRGGLKLADRGVIPRLLSGIYRRGKKIAKDSNGETTVQVALSYYEIYNDKVFDLFEPPDKRLPAGLPLREKDGKTIVVGLSERECQDLKDFERLYIEANNNRITAATKLNAHSSRSHAILRVKVTQISGDTVRESTASAIDLAGSEDNRRTENNKERLIESAAINKSLFVLSQCVDAISRRDKRIPYRESKMTRILSLGQNNGITIMILNLAPLKSYHLDTLSSLNVSSRAKRIEVREIENEVVFKQMPRTTSTLSGPGIQRQPLKPLANAHNVHSGVVAAAKADPKAPVKAFNVYTDRSKPSVAARPLANTTVRRSNSNKRPSDSDAAPRPTRITRPTAGMTAAQISAAQIEAMVEKKVSEILASREAKKLEPTTAPQPDISEEVQRRLEALERRIEDEDRRDDGRPDGLRCLLAARQHRERGEDALALRAYEMALPFFPGQAKLVGKIERLRAKLGIQSEETSAAPKEQKTEKKKRKHADNEEEYEAGSDEDDTFVGKAKSHKTKKTSVKTTAPMHDDGLPPTPKARRLLNIVNSRDVSQIQSLSGFGPKKARDLVEWLSTESAMIENISQLRTVPGMRGKTVDRVYEGLVVVA